MASKQRQDDCERAWQLKQNGRTFTQIAHELGYVNDAGKPQRGKVQRMILDHGAWLARSVELGGQIGVSSVIVDDYSLQAENERLRRENEQLRIESNTRTAMFEASSRDDTDWDQWDEIYERLSKLDRMIVVHTISDMHIPDDNDQCIQMDLAINAAVKPDITIFNGDMFDFDVLSLKYKRMFNRRRVDPFWEVEPRWDYIVGEVQTNNPNGIIMATGDNHGQIRMENYINEVAMIFGDRLTADYNELVRSHNRVLWLGWEQEIYMNRTVFEHGKRSGANPAMANFKSHGESFSGVAGHAHRWQMIVTIKQLWLQEQRRMLYYPLVSAVAGTSQNIPPSYITDTKALNSTQGSAVSFVNLHGFDTHVQNIVYHPRVDGSLVAVYGNEVFTQQAAVSAMRKAG